MDYEDEYDEFDDYNYDDAAEDWEAEAEQEERDARVKEAALAARKEEKLATRAPVDEAPAVEEAVVELTLQQAIDKLHSSAAEVASAADLVESIDTTAAAVATADDGSGAATSTRVRLPPLFAALQVDEAAHASAAGVQLATHLMQNSRKSNYADMLGKLFELIASDYKDMTVLNRLIAKVHIAQEELKRKAKDAKAHKASAPAVVSHDALGLDAIDDKAGGGGAVRRTRQAGDKDDDKDGELAGAVAAAKHTTADEDDDNADFM